MKGRPGESAVTVVGFAVLIASAFAFGFIAVLMALVLVRSVLGA